VTALEVTLHDTWDEGWRAGVQALLARLESGVAQGLPDEAIDRVHQLAAELLDDE
jgi:hypothetical protein